MPLTSVERPRGGPESPTRRVTIGRTGDEPPSRPPDDAVFEILRASRRREVLRYLDAHGGEAKIGAIAEYIAARENDVDRAAVTSSQRKRAYVGLYQMHLPKMDGYGVVEWNKDRGFVKLLGTSRWFLAYLYFDPARNGSTPENGLGTIATVLGRIRRIMGH